MTPRFREGNESKMYKTIIYKQRLIEIETRGKTTKKPYFEKIGVIYNVDFKEISATERKALNDYKQKFDAWQLIAETIKETQDESTTIASWHNSKIAKYMTK